MKRFLALFLTILMVGCCFGLLACKQHEHVFDRKVTKSEYRKTIATCYSGAVYYKSCSCGKKGEETFNASGPLGHLYTNRVCIRCRNVLATSEGLVFKSIDENTCSLYDIGICLDNDIVIPSEYGGKSVVTINDEVFKNNDRLESITIPKTITSIGKYAFSECDNLTSVIFAEDSEMKIIGANAFENCNKLTSITLPNTVTDINRFAFSNCVNLEELGMPTSLKNIGTKAFTHCFKLKNITIPNGTMTIEESAFEFCDSIQSIIIPSSVNTIEASVFSGCINLTNIIVENNDNFMSSDGDLYSKDGKTLLQYAIGKKTEKFVVPNGVKIIDEKAFYLAKNLISITLPSTLTDIANEAFNGCDTLFEVYNLSNIEIVKGSERNGGVAYKAVDVYSSLAEQTKINKENGYIIYSVGQEKSLMGYTGTETELIIPNGVTKIEKDAFEHNTQIESLSIPASVKTICEFAFAYCSNLTTITIEKGLTNIESGAFLGCSKLNTITYEGTIDEWNNIPKGSSWNFSTPKFSINCADGTI